MCTTFFLLRFIYLFIFVCLFVCLGKKEWLCMVNITLDIIM